MDCGQIRLEGSGIDKSVKSVASSSSASKGGALGAVSGRSKWRVIS